MGLVCNQLINIIFNFPFYLQERQEPARTQAVPGRGGVHERCPGTQPLPSATKGVWATAVALCLQTRSPCLPSPYRGPGAPAGSCEPAANRGGQGGKSPGLGHWSRWNKGKDRFGSGFCFNHQVFTPTAARKAMKICDWAVEVRLPSPLGGVDGKPPCRGCPGSLPGAQPSCGGQTPRRGRPENSAQPRGGAAFTRTAGGT